MKLGSTRKRRKSGSRCWIIQRLGRLGRATFKCGVSYATCWSATLTISGALTSRRLCGAELKGLGSSGGSCRLVWAPIRSLSETLRRYVDRIIRFVRRLIIDSFVCATLKGHKALLTPLGFLGFRCEFDCVTRMHYYILIIFLCLLH